MAIPENPFVGKKCIQEDDPIRLILDNKMNSEDHQMFEEQLDREIMKVCG